MGFKVILRLITFLVLFVGGDPLVLRSSDHVSSPALTPTSDRALAPNHYDKHSPSKHHAKRWTKRGLRPFSSISFQRYHHERSKVTHFAPTPSYQVQPPTYTPQGSPGPAPSPVDPTSRSGPSISPSSSSLTKETADPPTSVFALPPPPPNEDCTTVTCTQPLTYTPAGSPCACVWPIEVKLRLAISPYTFFPLVSELAHEISTSVSLNVSQARIMGANADGEQLDKTIVLVNLVPLKQNFDPATAFSIYQKFWKKQVLINKPRFGAYEVVNIKYPGLPPSPPSVPLNGDVTVDQSDSLNNNKGMPFKPIGVDIPRNGRDNKSKTNGSMVTVVILSSVTAFVVIIGAFWLLLMKCGCCCYSDSQTEKNSPAHTVSQGKPSGTGESLIVGSRKSSETMSFSSSLLAYTGTAKIYSLSEIEKATDNFNSRNILGEGGFGVVYSGILEDERKVAVKVLKRDDRQGSREFLAEVEMLSRLHHRNLVKLFGICTHDHFRCLVYELVPNGSVESHLHGADKTAPLSWCARMKIALGAARGLAYLHEDSSPRVIHRDFKASNILLENDFTPKVSDFGLARTALDGHKHISTHVMGTFGYWGEDRLAADSFDKRLRSQSIGFNMPTRDVGLDSSHDIINSVEGYWEQQPTDYHDSSLAYMSSLQFGGRMKSMLIDVDVQVQSGYQREHVPMISLMSKLNDKAIVGHPIPVETIQDGSSDIILSAAETYEYQTESLVLDPDDTALQPWRTARRTAKCRVPRPPAQDEDYAAADEERKYNNRKGGSISRKWPSPKLQKKPQRRSVLSHSQKIRTLSSIGGGGDQISDLRAEEGVMKPAAAAVACIPVKLVFSRLHEELVARHQ